MEDEQNIQEEIIESNSNKPLKLLIYGGLLFAIGLIVLVVYYNNSPRYISYGNGFPPVRKTTINEQLKINRVLSDFTKHAVGIDISRHQGRIKWQNVKFVKDSITLDFLVIRSTMGSKAVDSRFIEYWNTDKDTSIVLGAYHYYRPNENSTKQAKNYIDNVKLNEGDLPPILDIEKRSSIQSMSNLRKGLLNWLEIVETYYGVTPIIYSGDNFYKTFLDRPEFAKYPKWIANYNDVKHPKTRDWCIWQFSEEAKIDGINELVDLNVFNGDSLKLVDILID